MLTESEIKIKLKAFITAEYLDPETSGISDDDSLFESGLISSFGLIELLAFIRRTFGAELEASRLNTSNFNTVNLMTRQILNALAEE